MNELRSKAIGCLAGAAVGDALGSATEGWSHEQILKRYGGPVTGIVAPYNDARAGTTRYQKGDGRVTDDTLMTRALVEVYRERRRHLSAYDIAEVLVPMLMNTVRWLPDMEREDTLLQRLFLAEKWLVTKLHYAHTDPRGVVGQQYAPDDIDGATYYEPGQHGAEAAIAERLERIRAILSDRER